MNVETAGHDGTEVRPRVELSFFNLDAADDAQVLGALAGQAEAAGWVTPRFNEALVERERSYPTGLPTPTPVAIPHADVEHVLKSGLGIALLKNPVRFGEMAGIDTYVDVRVVVLILVTDPDQQVELLTRLVDLFQQSDWFAKIERASGVADLVEIFARMLGSSPGWAAKA